MQWGLKQIMAGAVVAAIGSAQASVVIGPSGSPLNGWTVEGLAGIKLDLSGDMLGFLDTSKTSVQVYGASSTVVSKDTDGYYTQVASSTLITSMTVDANQSLQALTSTGGLTLVTPLAKSVSSGGSLTITDLAVDLVNKKIFGDVIGANGVGAVAHVPLMNIESITGSTSVAFASCTAEFVPRCTYGVPNFSLSGLAFTSEGANVFSQSLGLLTLGKAALPIVNDGFGFVSKTYLPEPSSYALMGLGLAGIWATQRRRYRSQRLSD